MGQFIENVRSLAALPKGAPRADAVRHANLAVQAAYQLCLSASGQAPIMPAEITSVLDNDAGTQEKMGAMRQEVNAMGTQKRAATLGALAEDAISYAQRINTAQPAEYLYRYAVYKVYKLFYIAAPGS